MKKIYTTFLALSICLLTNAQTEKGTLVLGAGSSLSNVSLAVDDVDPGTLNGSEISSNNMDLELSGGIFVADNLMLGLTLSVDGEGTKTESSGYEVNSTTTTTTIAPTIRYYFGESGVSAGVSYAIGSVNSLQEETGYEDYEEKQSITGLMINTGYSFFVSDIVAITPSLSYAMMTSTLEDGYWNGNNYEDLEIKMSGLSLGLGISIHFNN